MNTYVLYRSESQSTFTLVSAEHCRILEADAEEIWRVQAKSWEIARLKEHEFLSWDPYRPQITCDADLLAYLPSDKHDLDNVQLLLNLGYPAVKPVLRDLFEWVQDINWPVARAILPFLASLGSRCREEVREILRSQDGMWKLWVISEVVGKMDQNEASAFRADLQELMQRLTDDDRDCDVHLAAQSVLDRLRRG